MDKIFEIVFKVATPLALSGTITAIFFFILQQIVSKVKNTFRHENFLKFIINELFFQFRFLSTGILNKAFYNVAAGLNETDGLDIMLSGLLWFKTLKTITNSNFNF